MTWFKGITLYERVVLAVRATAHSQPVLYHPFKDDKQLNCVSYLWMHFNLMPKCRLLTHWRRELFSESRLRVSASLGHTGLLPNRSFSVCGFAGRARFALHGKKAHCSVACGSIHASTFLWPGLQTGPIVKLVIFMQIWPFHFLTTHKGQSPYIQEPGSAFFHRVHSSMGRV